MINIETIPDNKLSQTLRLMKAEATARGWRVNLLYQGSAHCYIDRGDGRMLHVFSATPPTTSYAAAHLANNKYATHQVLAAAELPQLPSMLATEQTPLAEQQQFVDDMGVVVAKPVDGGHGKGITVNIRTADQLSDAFRVALSETKGSREVLLQKQYSHDIMYDIRILCIDYTFVAATWRVPARVIGDGVHTIRELIITENAQDRRGIAYYSLLATIDVEKAEVYLKDRIDMVPDDGQEVFVLGIANYGAGGETIDITDDLPDWLLRLAEQAARICELPIAGVDFMIAAKPSIDATAGDLDAVIIEINKCPMLAMHDLPTSGTPRHAVQKYMDYLASL